MKGIRIDQDRIFFSSMVSNGIRSMRPLSLATSLWSSLWAVAKINFCPKRDGKHIGTLLIAGATNNLGQLASKILSQSWNNIVLVSDNETKAQKLKEEIAQISANSHVVISKTLSPYIEAADMIVTTSANHGKKIDIETIAPGCVVCNLGKTFHIKESQTIKRPDVLFIAGGELELPQEVYYLHKARELSYEKLQDIERDARNFKVKLASVKQFKMDVTEEEINLCRQHALTRFQNISMREKL